MTNKLLEVLKDMLWNYRVNYTLSAQEFRTMQDWLDEQIGLFNEVNKAAGYQPPLPIGEPQKVETGPKKCTCSMTKLLQQGCKGDCS